MTQPAPPTKATAPPVDGGAPEDGELIDQDTLQAAIDATDTLDADDPDGAAAIRKLCMAEATTLGLGELIPDTWNTDGSVGDPPDEPTP